jgi:hypothetical protein
MTLGLLRNRFGALNDAVASRELLQNSLASLPDETMADSALSLLKREQRRRIKPAAKLL